MIVTELRVQVSKTINLGNFNSIKIEGGLTAAVGDGEDIGIAKAALQRELKSLLEETYRAQRKPQADVEAEPPAPYEPARFAPAGVGQ